MKVLVAASGSPNDAAATGMFPWPPGSEIRVLTVAEIIEPATLGLVPPVMDMPDVQVHADDAAHLTAEAVAKELARRGLNASAVSIEGDPKTTIIDYAKQWGADLIVVGLHDRSRVEKFLVGSVSESVVRHAPCSVLVVKHSGLE